IEVLRLDNLLERARLVLESDNEGHFPAGSLEKLERFLRGRIILTWNRTETIQFFRTHFGSAVDIDAADLSSMAADFFPSMAGKSFNSLHQASRLRKYRQHSWIAIDTLWSIFSATIMHRMMQQGFLTDRMFQLAALGTVADLMPLKDENRIIVRRGMEGINTAPSNGIRELKLALNLARPLNATDLAWQITPAINAAGRLGTPTLALDLLAAGSTEEALSAASRLVEANVERRRLGTEAWEHIREALNESLERSEGRYAIIATSQIRPGITGLLASRAANMMKVPVIVAALREDGTCTGSIRAGSSFPLTKMLAYCADLFMDYGGHDSAAGFTLKTERWETLVARMVEFMSQVPAENAEPEIRIDAELPHSYVTPNLVTLCQRFEPFGEENAPLLFCSREVPMVDAQIVGRNGKSHLKLTLDFGTFKWPALLWDGAERLERDFSFRNGDRVDILYKVTLNYWNGEERPQLELFDIRRSGQEDLCVVPRTAPDT
ncbi:MAG: DHH family phosphoesterase, partial [Rectinema sp.]|nr:DHH family phosphoesterase [Rectinema sp.]